MGVKVQLDAAALEHVKSDSTGLLLGFRTPQIRILSLVSTPDAPKGTSVHRWSVEHAKLLKTMCVGGIAVLGAFAPLGDAGKSSSPIQIDTAAALARDVIDSQEETCVILCTGLKGRILAKEVCDIATGVRSADLKEVTALRDGVVIFEGTLDLPNINTPCQNESDLRESEESCSAHAESLVDQAVLTLGADQCHTITNLDQNKTLADMMGWNTQSNGKKNAVKFSKRATQTVNIFLPYGIGESYLTKETVSRGPNQIQFSGALRVLCAVMQDSTAGELLQSVRRDARLSLATRIALLHDAGDGDGVEEESASCEDLGRRALPARVIAFPRADGTGVLPFADYMLPGESVIEDVTSRLAEVLSWDSVVADEYGINAVEDFGSVMSPKTEFHSQHVAKSVDQSSSMKELDYAMSAPSALMQNALVVAVVLAIVAIIIKEVIMVIF